MNSKRLTGSIVLALAAAGCSGGGPDCTTEPKSSWMPESQMKEHVEKLGYKIDVFKVSGTCYEVYGRTKDGQKAEVYFNPVDGAVVRSEIE